MTIHEQVVLAVDKVAHWSGKRDHALAMLTKWQSRLQALQSKSKPQPQPTAKKLPPLTLVVGTERLLPRAAVTSPAEQAAVQAQARYAVLREKEAKDAGDKVVPITNGKTKPTKGKTPPPKKR